MPIRIHSIAENGTLESAIKAIDGCMCLEICLIREANNGGLNLVEFMQLIASNL